MQAAREKHPDRLFVTLSRTTDAWSADWEEAVRVNHIPFLQGYGRGPRALGKLAEYSRFVHGAASQQAARSGHAEASPAAAGQPLDEIESKKILADAGIPVVETVLATSADDAAREATRLGYPAVLKVVAPEITHKSAAGGVRLNLADAAAVQRAFAELNEVAAKAGATFRGVSVQSQARAGTEILLGAQRDAQFGPVVLCGLGGVFVEVLNDVALRLVPITLDTAQAMLGEIKGHQVLDGADKAAIAKAICSLSDLMAARSDIASIDVNPIFAYTSGITAVDARVQLA
jgi:acyl-CoA synthetase (NDP forming)